MIDEWLIDKFRFRNSDKSFFHGGVKQYKIHTRTPIIASYLISYVHYKLKYIIQLPQKQLCTITVKYNTNNIQRQSVKYNTNNIHKQTA